MFCVRGDSVRTVEPRFHEKHVALSVDVPLERCDVLGDEARLRQVIVNLLSNAVKFTASGGHVEVCVTCHATAAVVVVKDTGIGIHPDLLPHVFERFRQGDTDSTTGLGLGLAIVRTWSSCTGARLRPRARVSAAERSSR